jgi:hypothetical protein
MFNYRSATLVLIALTLVVGLSGCRKEQPKMICHFYMESNPGFQDVFTRKVTLPATGQEATMASKPFLQSGDVLKLDLAQVTLPDGSPLLGFLFQFSEKGTRELFRQTANNQGKRIFLLVNNQVVGIRPIDVPISDGQLFMISEIPDDDMPSYVAELSVAVTQARKIAESRF